MKTKQQYKPQGQRGLFDDELTAEKLKTKGKGKLLTGLSRAIDFEYFRQPLEDALRKPRLTNAGAKAYAPLMMFKILVLQRVYNLSDEDTEYQILDRISFRDFLGLASGDRVPDQNTIRNFREKLVELKQFDVLFDHFYAYIEAKGLIMEEGIIVDGSFMEVPRQHNTREENAIIKAGEGHTLWNPDENDSPREKQRKANKKRQKDTDARYTKKGNKTYYGYEVHDKIDAGSKFIKKRVVTHAAVHDSKMVSRLVNEKDRGQPGYFDSAYIGPRVRRALYKYGIRACVVKHKTKGKELSKNQKTRNKRYSKTRARVEHVFGFCEQSLHGMGSRLIGMARNEAYGQFSALVYNLCRYEQVTRIEHKKVAA